MSTPKPGNQADPSELPIYTNELPTITKEIWEKLQNLIRNADTIEVAAEEEVENTIPKHEMFSMNYLISPLWEKFDVILLQQNHRQGKDRRYAELLNRARVGNLSEEDELLLSMKEINQRRDKLEILKKSSSQLGY